MQKFRYSIILSIGFLGTAQTSAALQVHGHRGARARFPENTLAAFDHALKAGVDFLELDLVVSKDDVLIIAHDPYLNPKLCLGPDGQPTHSKPLIRSLTHLELQKYDCGSLKNEDFPKQTTMPGSRMPSLDEFFEFVRGSKHPNAKQVRFNIETKIYKNHPEYTPDAHKFIDLLLAALARHNMQNRSIVQSFEYSTLEELRKRAPEIPRSALTNSTFRSSLSIARETQAQYLSPLWLFVNERYVQRLHNLGVRVIPFTVNKEYQWRRMINDGVDGMITDDPEALIEFLKKKGLR